MPSPLRTVKNIFLKSNGIQQTIKEIVLLPLHYYMFCLCLFIRNRLSVSILLKKFPTSFKVYFKCRETYCKSRHISVNSNGIVVLSVGFVSEHRALSDKPFSDLKIKIFVAENEDEKLSIFREIEFSL